MDAPFPEVPRAQPGLGGLATHRSREEPPFTGRAREIAALLDAVLRAGEAGRLTQVVVSGPPGIGKSRLLWELGPALRARRARPRGGPADDGAPGGDPVLVSAVAGEGVTSAAGLAGQIVRARFELEGGLSDDLCRVAIRRGLERWVPVVARGRWVGWLGSLVGLPLEEALTETGPRDTRAWRRRALRALGEVLRFDAAERTIVLTFDGLDRVPEEEREALSEVLRPLRDRGAVVVFSTREPSASPAALPDAETLRLDLEPLADDEALHILASQLGEPTPAAVVPLRPILADAGGRPGRLLELLRALTSAGALSVESGRLVVDEERLDFRTATDPRSAAAARVALLGGAEREVLSAAAVFGDHFWFDGVLSILWAARSGEDRDPTDADRIEMGLQRTLLDLMRRDLVRFVDETRGRSARAADGTAELAFAFPVERRAILDAMPEPERRRLSAWAGRWMLRASPREPHTWYRNAARMLEGTDRKDLALEAWIRAGDAALLRERGEAALHAFQRALEGLDRDDERRARVLPGLAEVQEELGQRELALETTSQLLRWARVLGDRALAARAMLRQGRLLERLEKPVQAREVLARAMAQFDALGLADERALGEEALARLAAHEGTAHGHVTALAHLEHALHRWRMAERALDVARVESRAAAPLLARGRLPQAREGAARAAASFRDAGDAAGLARALNLLGSAAVLAGDAAAAREAWEEALRGLEEGLDGALEATLTSNLAEVHLLSGDLASAEEAARAALRRARVLGVHRLEGLAHHRLGAILRQRGRLADARFEAETALRLGEATGDRRLEALGRRGLAAVEARNLARRIAKAEKVPPEELESVGKRLHDACLHAEALGDRPGLARSLESYAEYLDAWGAGRKARKVWLRAEKLREAMIRGDDGIPEAEPETGGGSRRFELPDLGDLADLDGARTPSPPLRYGEPFDV